jgi:hypothetical protein
MPSVRLECHAASRSQTSRKTASAKPGSGNVSLGLPEARLNLWVLVGDGTQKPPSTEAMFLAGRVQT